MENCTKCYLSRSARARASTEKEQVDRQCVPINLHLQIFSVFDIGPGFSNHRHRAPTRLFAENESRDDSSAEADPAPASSPSTPSSALRKRVVSSYEMPRLSGTSRSQVPAYTCLQPKKEHPPVSVLRPRVQYHTVTWGAPCSHHDGFSKYGGGASLIHKQVQDLNARLTSKDNEVRACCITAVAASVRCNASALCLLQPC